MNEAVISLSDVSLIRHAGTPIESRVLKGINIEITGGETAGIIGPPGSGKTTLAKVMAGLIGPSSGDVKTPGVGPGRVGLVFQFPEHQLFCDTVFNDITYTLKEVLRSPASEVEKSYTNACLQVDLDPDLVRERRPDEMSGGERRRAAIAGVLAMAPEVLIFDEPTAGLDQEGRTTILKEIARLSGEGKTVVVISHNIEELLPVTGRMFFVEGGEIVESGDAHQVLGKIADRRERFRMLPFVTELLVRLNEKGLDVRRDIFEPDEALSEIKRALVSRQP